NLKSQLFAECRATFECRARFTLTWCLRFNAKRFKDLARHWADDHDHLAAFHLGHVLDLAKTINIGSNALQQGAAQILMRHLTTAKAQSDFDFVTVFQKSENVAHFDVVV